MGTLRFRLKRLFAKSELPKLRKMDKATLNRRASMPPPDSLVVTTSANATYDQVVAELDKIDNATTKLKALASNLQWDKSSVEHELDEKESTLSALNRGLKHKDKELTELKREMAQILKDSDHLKKDKELTELKKEMAQALKDKDYEFGALKKEAEREIAKKKKKIVDLREENEKLREKLQKLQK